MIPPVFLELNLAREAEQQSSDGGLAAIPNAGNVGPVLCQVEICLRQLWALCMWEAERSPLRVLYLFWC